MPIHMCSYISIAITKNKCTRNLKRHGGDISAELMTLDHFWSGQTVTKFSPAGPFLVSQEWSDRTIFHPKSVQLDCFYPDYFSVKDV